MAVRIIAIGRDDFHEIVTSGASWVELPVGARIVDVRVNFDTDCLEMKVDHADWPAMPEGCRIDVYPWRLGLAALAALEK